MKKLLMITVLVPLFLISCGKSEEVKTVVNPPVVEKQVVTTSPVVTTGSIIESSTGKIEKVSTGVVSESGTTISQFKEVNQVVLTGTSDVTPSVNSWNPYGKVTLYTNATWKIWNSIRIENYNVVLYSDKEKIDVVTTDWNGRDHNVCDGGYVNDYRLEWEIKDIALIKSSSYICGSEGSQDFLIFDLKNNQLMDLFNLIRRKYKIDFFSYLRTLVEIKNEKIVISWDFSFPDESCWGYGCSTLTKEQIKQFWIKVSKNNSPYDDVWKWKFEWTINEKELLK